MGVVKKTNIRYKVSTIKYDRENVIGYANIILAKDKVY